MPSSAWDIRHIRLQPAPPTVAACTTYGCSLHHLRLQVKADIEAYAAACDVFEEYMTELDKLATEDWISFRQVRPPQ